MSETSYFDKTAEQDNLAGEDTLDTTPKLTREALDEADIWKLDWPSTNLPKCVSDALR